MKKSVAVIAAGSAAILVLTAPAALARSGQAPTPSLPSWATHTGALTGSPAYLDFDSNLVLGQLTGNVSLSVDQMTPAPVVLANIDLPDGFLWAEDVSVTLESHEGAGSTLNPDVSIEGGTVTVKGFSIADTDSSGTVEFTLTVEGLSAESVVATTTIVTSEPEVTFAVSSQYRTSPDRRNKAFQSWVASTPGVITLASGE